MKKGFTLIELILTVVVISGGLVGIMALFQNAARGAAQVDLDVRAIGLVQEELEEIVKDRAVAGYALLDQSNYPDEVLSGDFSVYSRRTRITEVAENDFTTLQPGSGYKRVEVSVSWGEEPVKSITIPTVLADY